MYTSAGGVSRGRLPDREHAHDLEANMKPKCLKKKGRSSSSKNVIVRGSSISKQCVPTRDTSPLKNPMIRRVCVKEGCNEDLSSSYGNKKRCDTHRRSCLRKDCNKTSQSYCNGYCKEHKPTSSGSLDESEDDVMDSSSNSFCSEEESNNVLNDKSESLFAISVKEKRRRSDPSHTTKLVMKSRSQEISGRKSSTRTKAAPDRSQHTASDVFRTPPQSKRPLHCGTLYPTSCSRRVQSDGMKGKVYNFDVLV